MSVKTLTRDQLQLAKERAVRFVEDVLDDPDRAAEIAEESLDDYAARRRIEIVENPSGGNMPQIRVMNPSRAELLEELRQQRAKNKELESQLAQKSPRERNPVSNRSDLLAQIRELEEQNDELQAKLDKVGELAEAPEDDEDESIDDLKDSLNEIIDVVAGKEGHSGNE